MPTRNKRSLSMGGPPQSPARRQMCSFSASDCLAAMWPLAFSTQTPGNRLQSIVRASDHAITASPAATSVHGWERSGFPLRSPAISGSFGLCATLSSRS
ncbi:hypothetical protein [Bacillus sp. FJAT-26390]|uniref:hypothetical protein n=1 Tax=Bacillus sp. FJAT-26390 TaxID=1743142 RepID=UPI0021002C6C|nr:hypothetical protein [Bacillus sp. FJAT-26390]